MNKDYYETHVNYSALGIWFSVGVSIHTILQKMVGFKEIDNGVKTTF